MKIRNGFVSNSSASSFVVILPRRPESAADVESIFFPEGFDNRSWDYEDKVTGALLAETIWADIVKQREIPDVKDRLLYVCNRDYAIRDLEDALLTMQATSQDRERILGLQDDAPEQAAQEFVQLILDTAHQQGDTVHCSPDRGTTEVYCLCYGSGCGVAEGVMFNNFNFISHLPFTIVMKS